MKGLFGNDLKQDMSRGPIVVLVNADHPVAPKAGQQGFRFPVAQWCKAPIT
jgi:hypothetical protein